MEKKMNTHLHAFGISVELICVHLMHPIFHYIGKLCNRFEIFYHLQHQFVFDAIQYVYNKIFTRRFVLMKNTVSTLKITINTIQFNLHISTNFII